MASLLGFKPVTEGERNFLSYNRDDSHRIKPIAMKLDEMGIPMWYDDGILHGDNFETEISRQIRASKTVIMFITTGVFLKLTEQGVGWVAKEFRIACNNGIKVLPVILDNINPRYVPDEYQGFWVDVSYIEGVPFNGDNTADSIAEQIAYLLGARGAARKSGGSRDTAQTTRETRTTQTEKTRQTAAVEVSPENQIKLMTKNGARIIDRNERKLSLENLGITDISPLAGMTQLSSLIISGNDISDITPLRGLTSLCVLNLSGNNIADLSPLRKLTNLTWLFLSDNNISDLSPLAALTRLTNLDLRNNRISNVMALGSLVKLSNLRLGGNPVSGDDLQWLDEILPDCDGINH